MTDVTPLIYDEQRFLSKLEDSGRCWLWRAAIRADGYGAFWVSEQKRVMLAHRFAYERWVGPIPEGLTLDHLCRVRCCVNPAHLEAVTGAENTRRGIGGLLSHQRALASSHCRRGHEWTPENTYLPPKSPGQRQCRECKAQMQRERRAARRWYR